MNKEDLKMLKLAIEAAIVIKDDYVTVLGFSVTQKSQNTPAAASLFLSNSVMISAIEDCVYYSFGFDGKTTETFPSYEEAVIYSKSKDRVGVLIC